MSEFEDKQAEKKLSELYQALAKEEPPAGVDQAILKSAQTAAKHSRADKKPLFDRWMPSLATAAVIMLSATIVLKLLDDDSHRLDERFDQPLQQAPADKNTLEKASQDKKSEKSAPAFYSQPQLAPEDLPASAPLTQEQESHADLMEPMSAPKKMAPKRAQQPNTEQLFSAPAPVSSEPMMDVVEEQILSPDKPIIKSAPAETGLNTDTSLGRSAAPAQLKQKSEAPSSTSVDEDRLLESHRTVEIWLKEMNVLLNEGKNSELAIQLTLFRKSYPDYQLPDALAEKELELLK